MKDIVRQFAQLWAQGARPEISTYLDKVDPHQRNELLRLLLPLEITERIRLREEPLLEDYTSLGDSAEEIFRKIGQKQNESFDDSSQIGDQFTTAVDSGQQVSRRIGNYKLLQILGEGGMGVVWMAQQEKPVRRRVALKLIKSGADNKMIMARFEAERQALAMMDHQNIAKVFDAGTTDTGQPYFVMELVRGISFTKYCDKNKLSIKDRLELFIPVCKAIQHAHLKGIIHRDLKPSNILVSLYDNRPVPKVIDFGLAKALQHQPSLTDRTYFTEYGQVVGTLNYMSPEQAEMNQLDVDTRSDIYSLGVILYEILSGTTPIEKEFLKKTAILKVLEAIRESEPARPSLRLSSLTNDVASAITSKRGTETSTLKAQLSGDLDWIVMKAIEKDRTRRYETANAFAEDVQRFLDDEVVIARPPTAQYLLSKFIKKHRALVGTLAIVLTLLVAGIAGTSWFAVEANKARIISDTKTVEATREKERADLEARRARNAEDVSRQNEQQARSEAERARKAEAKAKINELNAIVATAKSNLALAEARWEDSRVDDAIEFLDRIPVELRDLEWYLARRRCRGSIVTCFGHRNAIFEVAYSPDGQYVASSSSDNSVRLWDVATGKESHTLLHPNRVFCTDINHDGTLVATGCEDFLVRIWDAKTGEVLRVIEHPNGVESLAFSPVDNSLAAHSQSDLIRIWDADTGKMIGKSEESVGYALNLSFSPDGKKFATTSYNNITQIVNVSTGKVLKELSNPSISHSVAFSPDGLGVACGSQDGTIWLWDLETETIKQTISAHDSSIKSLAFSPDGARIVSGCFDSTIKAWRCETGEALFTLRGHLQAVSSVRFGPDGNQIVSGGFDGLVKIWDSTSGLENAVYRKWNNTISSVRFLAGGKTLAVGDGSRDWYGRHAITLLDVESGVILKTLHGHADGIRSLAVNRDETLLASASYDGKIKTWNLKSGVCLNSFSGHQRVGLNVHFSPDSTELVSSGLDGTIRFWNVKSGMEIKAYRPNGGAIWGSDLNGDFSQIAVACEDQTIKLLDTKSGEKLKTFYGHSASVNRVIFSPDNKHLISASEDKTIRIWEVASGQLINTLKGHLYEGLALVINEDQSRIISASADQSVRQWDFQNGDELGKLNGHSDIVSALDLEESQQVIATGSYDKTVCLWKATRTQEFRIFRRHGDVVKNVSIRPDGSQVFSVSDSQKLVWDVETGQSKVVLEPPQWDLNQFSSADNRWLVLPSGDDIILVDLEFKDLPEEKAYRKQKFSRSSIWHGEQATAAERSGNWFAAASHRGWQRQVDPQSLRAYVGLDIAMNKLKANSPELVDFLPPDIDKAFETAEPTEFVDEAELVCKLIWEHVIGDELQPTEFEVNLIEYIGQHIDSRIVLNTMGLVQNKLKKYDRAIKFSKQSLEKHTDSPFDVEIHRMLLTDLNVLAIAYFEQGDSESSDHHYQRLLSENEDREKLTSVTFGFRLLQEVEKILNSVEDF